MWAAQIHALSGFRVVAYDHRGHGESPAPAGPYTLSDLGGDVLRLLDRLGLERCAYAGLSLGGMVGLWLAARHPDRVQRLAVLCSSARLGPPEYWHERAARVRLGGTAAIADAVVERWFTPAFRLAHPDLVAGYRTMLTTVASEAYAGCCEAIAQMDLTGLLTAIRASTLVIAAECDEATPPSHSAAMAAGIPGARLVVLPAAAHLASVEAADLVTRLLAEHLEGH